MKVKDLLPKLVEKNNVVLAIFDDKDYNFKFIAKEENEKYLENTVVRYEIDWDNKVSFLVIR